jgi:glyoxalase-like protein
MRAYPWTRRELLRSCAAAGAFCFLGRPGGAEELMTATAAVDHLLLGAADLDRGIDWAERLTGVRAVAGGSHPGVGTRNALLSLGGRRYLEIIAPDPAQNAYNFPMDVRALAEPRLIWWAAASTDAGATAKKAGEAGLQVFGPRPGSRARPDGKTLRWTTCGVSNSFGSKGVEPIPFFIEWAADSPHPSQDSPKGCELQSFEVEHPKAAEVAALLEQLGIRATVKQAGEVKLTAVLETPKGKVVLS